MNGSLMGEDNLNGEIDENFWAQAAAERADVPDDPDVMGVSGPRSRRAGAD